jgi:hypothetical protein
MSEQGKAFQDEPHVFTWQPALRAVLLPLFQPERSSVSFQQLFSRVRHALWLGAPHLLRSPQRVELH